MLFELLRSLSVPNFKFWRIHLTRVDQYAKEKLILKVDFEFGILLATLPMGLCALLNNLFSYLIWFYSFLNSCNNNSVVPNEIFWLNWMLLWRCYVKVYLIVCINYQLSTWNCALETLKSWTTEKIDNPSEFENILHSPDIMSPKCS